MELRNPPITNNLSLLSPFPPIFSITTRKRTDLHKLHIPSTKLNKNRSLYLPLPCTKSSQVSAHFGQPTRRRNSLREKLVDNHKVRQISIPLNPVTETSDDNSNIESEIFENIDIGESSSVSKLKQSDLVESDLLSELENWVSLCRKEAEYWGIGSGPVFTVYEDFQGNVEKVKVNEDEILRRNRDLEDSTEVDSRILYAKKLAKEMEFDRNVIPRNSSVAKFVSPKKESSFVDGIRNVILSPRFIPNLTVIGRAAFCGVIVFWAAKTLFAFCNREVHYSKTEKDIMRRKMKSRQEKKMTLDKVSVEVVDSSVSFEKPKMDKQELMDVIIKSNGSKDESIEFNEKITEIREMAKRAREIESGDNEENSNVMELVDEDKEEGLSFLNKFSNDMSDEVENTRNLVEPSESSKLTESVVSEETNSVKPQDIKTENQVVQDTSRSSNTLNGDKKELNQERLVKNEQETVKAIKDLSEHRVAVVDNRNELHALPFPSERGLSFLNKLSNDMSDEVENTRNLVEPSESSKLKESVETNSVKAQDIKTENEVVQETNRSSNSLNDESLAITNGSVRKKPRVIRSVKEAKELLSRNRDKKELNQDRLVNTEQETVNTSKDLSEHKVGVVDNGNELPDLPFPCEKNAREKYSVKRINSVKTKIETEDSESIPVENAEKDDPKDLLEEDVSNKQPLRAENWVEKNFNEFEPIVEKMGIGFRANYTSAREKVSQNTNLDIKLSDLHSYEDGSELEWMKDDKLSEIVFQVRDNELAGRDPFYSMDNEDKIAFFKGLEEKVEKENAKLSLVHEYLHSNIENLDYGADGISLYDKPEKFVPRWKGPPLEKNTEFLDHYLEQRKILSSDKAARSSSPVIKSEQKVLQKSTDYPVNENESISSSSHDRNYSRTIISSSDGSVKAGKKDGKEYWKHTKKYSRGFLDSYNAETDPEIKSTMKDIGKDLDRWITEKEIEEAADLMDKLPERNKEFMEKKLNKLKREMELFGPQAVVTKYREYDDDKEEDYLWWLDLPHVLCIELYTNNDSEQRPGFYALEMATDLELEPKPHHVIAFEDAGDCKNLCYIIQAHLEMLGNGHAFIVPRPPKEAFREAKANGFGVTVIRKGELQLNVDQPLEEVEEQLCEIGSKMYHDRITKEQSVDISSLMKGVFGFGSSGGKPTSKKNKPKRRLKRARKKQ